MKKIYFLAVLMMTSLCSSMFSATGWPPPVDDYLVVEWQANAGAAAYSFGQIVYYKGGFYEVTNPAGVDSWGGVDYWNPENLSKESSLGAGCDCETDYVKIAEGRLWEEGMGTITAGVNYIWKGAVYECLESGESWGEGFSPTGWNAYSYKKVCEIELVPVDEGCLPDNFVGYFYRASLAWKRGWIGINWETKLAYECVSKTRPYDFTTEEGGEWPGSLWGYWYYGEGQWNDPPIPTCEEKDLLTTVDIPDWYECEWPLGAIVKHDGKHYIFNKLDGVIYYPSDQKLTIQSVLETLPYTTEVPGAGSNWTEYDPAKTQIEKVPVDPFSYFVQDGYFVVNSPVQVSIRLYNFTGQLIATAVGKSIELPEKGVYIAKINAGGKITVVKVLR
jgi:hypothetical protein